MSEHQTVSYVLYFVDQALVRCVGTQRTIQALDLVQHTSKTELMNCKHSIRTAQ